MLHIYAPLLDGPSHPCAVVVFLTEERIPSVGVGVEHDDGDRTHRPCGAKVRKRHGVITSQQEGYDFRPHDRSDLALDRLVAAFDVPGDDRDVAVVDAGQYAERVHFEHWIVATDQHRGGTDGVWSESPPDPKRDPGVERHADHREINLLEGAHVG